MAEGIARISKGEMVVISRQNNNHYLEVAKSMSALADRVVGGGGYCDEGTFLYSFFAQHQDGEQFQFGNREDFGDCLPKGAQNMLDKTTKIAFSRNEPYVQSSSRKYLTSNASVGVLVPSVNSADKSSMITYHIAKDSGNGYRGQVSFTGIRVPYELDSIDREIAPHSFNMFVVDRYSPAAETNVIKNYDDLCMAIGMTAIRQKIATGLDYLPDGMSDDVEARVAQAREYLAARAVEASIS